MLNLPTKCIIIATLLIVIYLNQFVESLDSAIHVGSSLPYSGF